MAGIGNAHITGIVTTRTSKALVANLPASVANMAGRLVTEAGFNLRVSHFGLDLYSRMLSRDLDLETLAETQQFVELGCENMISRSLVTCLDLCAATIAHAAQLHPVSMASGTTLAPDRQADVNLFGDRRYTLKASLSNGTVPQGMATWVTGLRSDHRWSLLSTWRDSVTHNWTQHNQTIVGLMTLRTATVGGQPVQPRPEPELPDRVAARVVIDRTEHDLHELCRDMVEFATDRFSAFVSELERAW